MTDPPAATSSAPSGPTVAVPRNEPASGDHGDARERAVRVRAEGRLPPTSARIPPSGRAWISFSSGSFVRTDLQANPLGVS